MSQTHSAPKFCQRFIVFLLLAGLHGLASVCMYLGEREKEKLDKIRAKSILSSSIAKPSVVQDKLLDQLQMAYTLVDAYKHQQFH
ncbi:transmembrane protein, putative [Medicago truncatula]|uniref:Transmembrane protein, putative n=1 Tax=Medicago truncatula TaxID=3880 RepID=A0A072UY75_MEDTR|nr:transmembrane protein, putative [Medicago truncatula]